jgi:hypothetical protein
MIKYIICAAASLGLVDINSVAAIRSNNDSKQQQGLRKLYYSEGHEVTDVQTMCEQVIEGDPKQCIIVCVEITSIKKGDELVGEYSKVNQRECEADWIDREGRTEWHMYSSTQSPTFYPTDLADDGHDVNIIWPSDGNDRVIDRTGSGSTSHTDEMLVAGGSKGSKGSKSDDGYSKGSNGGYSKSSKSKGGKGYDQSKSSKLYYVDNDKRGGGSGYSKSSKSSGVGDVSVWDAAILEPISDESEAATWFDGTGITEGANVSSSSKSSKPQSDSWSYGADDIKEGGGFGSSKSSKPTTAESASWSGGGSSKSSKSLSDSWSSGAGVIKEGSGSGSGSGSSKSSKSTTSESASWSGVGSGKSSNLRSGSSKSSKLVADSSERESAKRSSGGKGSSSSKSPTHAEGSADVTDGRGSISDGESGGWS